ncbi:uncharacterized protein EAE97_002778 [Botrytis byssoidea]|uniref:C2H2-type domain-containing protein n=1 Tax=Botrytis byssoidea TaxID=139641 RepID=A0A9P5LXY7_9HELO|nr:uncharacterized protein EAE97_002778 [Botrytis byssoidea]KAF7951227.1 hypothetical protein EAE97_002778 [Botrytis byssoidea]
MDEDNTKNHQRSIFEQAAATQFLLERYKSYKTHELLMPLGQTLEALETLNSMNVPNSLDVRLNLNALIRMRDEFNVIMNVLTEKAIAAFDKKYSSLQAVANSASIHSQNINQSRGSKKAPGLQMSGITDLTLDSSEGCEDIGVRNASEKSSNSVDYSIPHDVAQSTTITALPQSIQRPGHSSINQYIGEKPVLDGNGSTGPELAIQYAETQIQTANSTLKAPFDTRPLCSAPQGISLQTKSGSETVSSSTAARRRGDPHRCNVCSKTFTRGTTLREHERSHTNERPYQCSTCKKDFSRHKDCRRHELSHAKAKKFLCGGWNRNEVFGTARGIELGCGRSFTRMDAAKAHWNSLRGSECLRPMFGIAKEISVEREHFDDNKCSCGLEFESIDELKIHLDVSFQSSCLRHDIMELAESIEKKDYKDR